MALTGQARAAYGRAAEELAVRAPQVLHGRRGPGWLAGFAAEPADRTVALAAVRILDVEVLSVHLLSATPLSTADAEVLGQALTMFALVDQPRMDGPVAEVRRARDWAVAQLAGACGAELDLPGHMTELPAPVAPQDTQATAWPGWAAALATLAALAVPGLDSPLHRRAATGGLRVAQGATRAMLRRDFPVAAALTRWLVLPNQEAPPLQTMPLIEHIAACAGAPRTLLHTQIAAHLLRRQAGERP